MNFVKYAIFLAAGLIVTCSVVLCHEDNSAVEVGGDANRQTGVLSALGAAIAPAVGALLGPLFINIATGITNGITSTISSGFADFNMPRVEAYVVDNGDSKGPYIMLTTSPTQQPSQEIQKVAQETIAPQQPVQAPPQETRFSISLPEALFPGYLANQRKAH